MRKEYYETHKDSIIPKVVERTREYRKTQMGRAVRLCNNYKHADDDANRDEGNLTAQWIVENIFSKPCAHCGETDWHKIGCNRLDNSKPHTMDNVEPCCLKCNRKLWYKEHNKKIGRFTLDGELLKAWDSIKDCVKETNIAHGVICDCCNNKYLRDGNNIYKNTIFKII